MDIRANEIHRMEWFRDELRELVLYHVLRMNKDADGNWYSEARGNRVTFVGDPLLVASKIGDAWMVVENLVDKAGLYFRLAACTKGGERLWECCIGEQAATAHMPSTAIARCSLLAQQLGYFDAVPDPDLWAESIKLVGEIRGGWLMTSAEPTIDDLTADQIRTMIPGRVMDSYVKRIVMGWERNKIGLWVSRSGGVSIEVEDMSPSEIPNANWSMLWRHVVGRGVGFRLDNDGDAEGSPWICCLFIGERRAECKGSTPWIAICRAALLAKKEGLLS